MTTTQAETRREVRDITWLLSHLAERAEQAEPSEFLGLWRAIERRVLSCVTAIEREQGSASGHIERLRNLAWEVGISAELRSVHGGALRRLAQLFGELAGQSCQRLCESSADSQSVFGIC